MLLVGCITAGAGISAWQYDGRGTRDLTVREAAFVLADSGRPSEQRRAAIWRLQEAASEAISAMASQARGDDDVAVAARVALGHLKESLK